MCLQDKIQFLQTICFGFNSIITKKLKRISTNHLKDKLCNNFVTIMRVIGHLINCCCLVTQLIFEFGLLFSSMMSYSSMHQFYDHCAEFLFSITAFSQILDYNYPVKSYLRGIISTVKRMNFKVSLTSGGTRADN